MTIQKKSLISSMKTTKKALVASNANAASPVSPTVGLSKNTHAFSKNTHAFSKTLSKNTRAFSKTLSKAVK